MMLVGALLCVLPLLRAHVQGGSQSEVGGLIKVAPCPPICRCTRGKEGQVETAECSQVELNSLASHFGSGLVRLSLTNCTGEEVGDWARLGNSVEELSLVNCPQMEGVVEQLGGLTSLTIRDHQVFSWPVPCPSLDTLLHLELSGLGLQALPNLTTCTSRALPLTSLNLTHNDLTSLDWNQLEMFPDLASVDLSNNPDLSSLTAPRSKFFRVASLRLRDNSALASLCNSLLHSLPNLRSLDLTNTGLTSLPTQLLQLPHLNRLDIHHFVPLCSCETAVLIQQHLASDLFSGMTCRLPTSSRVVSVVDEEIFSLLACSGVMIEAGGVVDQNGTSNTNLSVVPGSRVVLDCVASGYPAPALVWLSPRYELLKWRPDPESDCDPVEEEIVLNDNIQDYSQWPGHLTVLPNGSLVLDRVGWRDRGVYTCYVDNKFGNDSILINLSIEHSYRNVIYYWSLAFGFVTAGLFLALTLLGKLLHYLLWNYGCCCCCSCCCTSRPAPKTQRLTTVVDSIETYRIQQLEKLRASYTMQSQSIRDNYSLQMERVRDHYANQSKGVGESYQTVKDQYMDQVGRIREYSNGQLARTHENYIFQRQRLRKFSAQNYLKIRETGKYTQKTLNRVLENMPALYVDLTSCRQGHWGEGGPDQNGDIRLQVLDTRTPDLEMIPAETQSLYFTPSGTPLREAGGSFSPTEGIASPGGRGKRGHKRMVSNLSNFFPFWWGMGQTDPGTTSAIVEPNTHNTRAETDTVEVEHAERIDDAADEEKVMETEAPPESTERPEPSIEESKS